MEYSPLANVYLEHLKDEGYRPALDDDGDIYFKKEGKTYLIILDEDDPTFFRLVFPNFWEIESDEERERVVHAASAATAATKVTKVFPVEDNVWASI